MRGQAIAAVSIISSAESFLVPPRIVERRLLELCLQGAIQDIRGSGQTGEAETQDALMVMRLVEDFIFSPGMVLDRVASLAVFSVFVLCSWFCLSLKLGITSDILL